MKYQLFFTCMLTMSLCYSGAPADDFKKVDKCEQIVRVVVTEASNRGQQNVSDDFLLLNKDWHQCRGDVVDVSINTLNKFYDAKIKGMSLRANRLTILAPTIFHGLTNITHLNLSGNKLTILPKGVFESVPLQRLSLWQNEFSTVPSEALKGLHFLTHLDLSDNKIEELSPGDFSDLGSLKLLKLGENKFKKFPPGTFTGLGALVVLSCFDNQLTGIDKRDFDGLDSLERLLLEGNKIKETSSDTNKWLEAIACSR